MIFEQSEDKVISFSDALSNPRTVVVISFDTHVADEAVVDFRILLDSANFAIVHSTFFLYESCFLDHNSRVNESCEPEKHQLNCCGAECNHPHQITMLPDHKL